MNFSKNRKFPDHFYDVYKLSKHDRGKYLNTWFKGDYFSAKKKKEEDIVYTDVWWTFKQVDKNTAWRLYDIEYNPIKITIMCPTGAKFTLNDQGEKLYNMLAVIHSIDDSSYGSWFLEMPYYILEEKRLELAKWIDGFKIINGNAFWNKCETMGATDKTYD